MEEAFNSPPEISSPPVSPFLAIATGPRFNLRWLIGIGVGITLILSISIFSLLCSGTFPLPENTFFLASISPKTANDLLTYEQQASLPNEWRPVLATHSSWPVLFGLTRTEQGIEGFVIGPRWSVPSSSATAQQTHAIIRQSGGLSSKLSSTESVIYRDRFFSELVTRGSLHGWIDASFLQEALSTTSSRIGFFLQEGRMHFSDLAKAPQISTSPQHVTSEIRAADLGIHLSALQEVGAAEYFLNRLPLEPLRSALSSLPNLPVSLAINLSSSTLQAVHLSFDQLLSSKDRSILKITLDQSSKKRFLALPDGTISVETYAPTDAQTGENLADSAHFEWQATSTSALHTTSPCSAGEWIARLSPAFLTRLTPTPSFLNAWIPKRAIQIWRDQSSFIVCEEK